MTQLTENSSLLIRNIKHDFINPINIIIGYSDIILEDQSLKRSISDDVKSINKSSLKILSILKAQLKIDLYHESSIKKLISDENFHYSIRIELASIIGLTELILEDSILDNNKCTDLIDYISKINKSAKAMLRLLHVLIKYSKLNDEEVIEKYFSNQYLTESSILKYNAPSVLGGILKNANLLIVDDEQHNLDIICKFIKKSEHKTYLARNNKEAEVILKEINYEIDIILLDLIMPGSNGLDFLNILKKNEKTFHIPVIILSALDEIDTIVECINAGAEDFLIKPVNKVLLNARINNALEKKYFHDKEIRYQEKIKEEQERSDKLLLNILPDKIASRLKDGETLIADNYDSATVLFADLKGFTRLSSQVPASELVLLLNNMFSRFDNLLGKFGLEKIKTIGDNYMLAGGVPEPSNNHAESVVEASLEMMKIFSEIKFPIDDMNLRIGINSGPVSAGVIGKKKFIYDLWGETVNIASRMESFGTNGKIHVSKSTYKLLSSKYRFIKNKKIDIKGLGLTQTYYIDEHSRIT